MSPRFRWLCRLLSIAVWPVLVLMIAGLGYVVAIPAPWMPGVLGTTLPPMEVWQHVGLGVIVVVVGAPMVLALLAMRRLFANYAEGRVFDATSASAIGRIGLLLAIGTLLKIGARPLGFALLTSSLPPGSRTVAISISSEDLVIGMLALLLLVIGRAMTEAVRIEADHRSII